MKKYFAMLVMAILLPMRMLQAEEASIQATLSTDKVALGESVELMLKVSGNTPGDPKIQEVPGLRFAAVGRSTQIQVINWKQSSSTTIVYQVIASKAGEYTIPPIAINSEGKTYQTQPLKLTVLKQVEGDGVNEPSSSASGAGNPKNTVLPEKEEGRLAFIRVTDLPDKIYVGQMVPITIRIYIQQRMSAKNVALPIFRGDAFSIQPLKFRQEEQLIEGIPYIVLSASTTMSAIKEGKFPLSCDVMVTVLRRQKGPDDDAFGNDPFFSDFFARTVAKNIKISSPEKEVVVSMLPEKGRPASFGGAIGKFDLKVTSNSQEVRSGDPLLLKMEVSGKGNFDRVTAPVLGNDKGWKSYNPSSSFKADDFASYQGTKIFEQTLIPMDADARKLPSIEFSYFDPEVSRYEILKPSLPSVTIIPAPESHPTTAVMATAASTGVIEPATTTKDEKDLVPMQVEIGEIRHDWMPLYAKTWFWGVQGVTAAFAISGLFLMWRHRRVTSTEFKQKLHLTKKVRESLLALESAIANENSGAFVHAAARVLRESYGHLWGINPESVTMADIRSHLGEHADAVSNIFEIIDAVTYAGRRLERVEMLDLKQKVVQELQRMEEKK